MVATRWKRRADTSSDLLTSITAAALLESSNTWSFAACDVICGCFDQLAVFKFGGFVVLRL